MVPPPDRSKTTPTPPKKPSSYSTLKYSPPKRPPAPTSSYIVNQKSHVESRTRIISISRSATPTSNSGRSTPTPTPRSGTPTKTNKHLAQPENFDIEDVQVSSRKEEIITSQPKETKAAKIVAKNVDNDMKTPLISLSEESPPKDIPNVKIIPISSYDLQNGKDDPLLQPGSKAKKNDDQCCDCLFNCFETLFILF